MNDREIQLMKSGMKLFAEKGYHGSSVQEIASAAGVSKGTFYLYFHSKEDFVTRAIQFHHEEIRSRLDKVQTRTNLSAEESLAAQIAILIDYVYTYKDFIMMHLRENVPVGQHTDQLILQMKAENFYWLRDNLQAMYPNTLYDYLIDAVIQSEGLLSGYFKWIVVEGVEIDHQQAGLYLTKQINNLVTGMLHDNEAPLVTWSQLPEEYNIHSGRCQETIHYLITQARTIIQKSDKSAEQQQQLMDVANMIESEALKRVPQRLILQGMLTHYAADPDLRELAQQLAEQLGVTLLHY